MWRPHRRRPWQWGAELLLARQLAGCPGCHGLRLLMACMQADHDRLLDPQRNSAVGWQAESECRPPPPPLPWLPLGRQQQSSAAITVEKQHVDAA